MLSAHASRLRREIAQVREIGGGMLYVDTAPHSDSAALEAAQTADLVLIPCRPAILDLEAINKTLAFLRTTATPVLVVLNAIAATGQDAQAAEAELTAHQVETCPVRLGRRIAFARSLVTGQALPGDSKAALLRSSTPAGLQDFNQWKLPNMANTRPAAAFLSSPPPSLSDPQPSASVPASSKFKRRRIGGTFDPQVGKRLRVLASEEETAVQELLIEALRLLFDKWALSVL